MEQITAVASPVAEVPSSVRVWPTFDHHIELDDARELIGRYKRANPGSRSAVAATRIPLDRILAQPGCVGVRMYFALNPDMTPTLVMVGVDEAGNDIDGMLAEQFMPCPPFCPMNSLLDS
ncbi:MAG TPA: hypothetical protein VGI92_00645 [Gemmatimonadales bacterium]|jgi:hypothetical protein